LLESANSRSKCNKGASKSSGDLRCSCVLSSGKKGEAMRHYKQITADERRTIAMLHYQGNNFTQIARVLGRHRSTISREYRRNLSERNSYESARAIEKTRARRSRSRKFCHYSNKNLAEVWKLLVQKHSPEQISNTLRLDGRLNISHETIYKFIWRNKKQGGFLYKHLRQSPKLRRKRYRSYDSRGQLAGKRPLEARPAGARNRSRTGHFEIDTVMGKGSLACLLTMVDRKTGFVHIQKMKKRNTFEANRAIFNVLHSGQLLNSCRIFCAQSDDGTDSF
jgi:IS30 family transposase